MNPIICPCRNGLYLTKKALATFRTQDIGGLSIYMIDNSSTDGTGPFLQSQRDILTIHGDPPMSVAESWNTALGFAFHAGADYALVVNNDVELRPDTYSYLVADGGGFVTAIGSNDPGKINPPYLPPDPSNKRPHPDFSCFLIRKSVWEKVGPFDENFKIAYCEDGDYDIRMHKAGIQAYSLDLPFLHHVSMTIKSSPPAEVRKIQVQADRNRKYFEKKWGFHFASAEYYKAKETPV